MSKFNLVWIFINIILILFILLRSPNEQSIQETIGSLKLFESSTTAEKSIDTSIKILILIYFIFGFFLAIKTFY